ncbi:MAG: hypothetical protein J0M02_00060 [Planctomycetes bacterium]|nr:hypothetical protein [Planctomycetota bacterium]
MPRTWHILLRMLGRHLVVVAGVVVVLLSSMQTNCLTLNDGPSKAAVATTQAVAVAGDAGAGDPLDPDGCGHCHCVAPSAVIEGRTVVIPAPLVSRNLRIMHPDDAPTSVSFVPDPPPNRA